MSRKDLIQYRRDTAANWTSVNPVLAASEIGFETDTNKFKMGDGTSTWTALAYQGGSGGGVSLTPSATQTIVAQNSTTIPLAVKGASGQVSDVFEIQNSSGTVTAGATQKGQMYLGNATPVLNVFGATTAASGTGTTATITFTQPLGGGQFGVGDTIVIAGVTPTGYNGTYTVTGGNGATNVTYANTTTGAQTVAGTVASVPTLGVGNSTYTTGLLIKNTSGTVIGTSSLLDIQSSTGSSYFKISPTGLLTFNSTGGYAFQASVVSSAYGVSAGGNLTGANNAGLVARATDDGGNNGPFNIAEFYDRTNVLKSYIASDGGFWANSGLTATTLSGNTISLLAGSATVAPIRLAAGTNLTTAAQGAQEFDGDHLFITGNTTTGNSRQIMQSAQSIKLATSASVASGGQFFTATVRPYLIGGNTYHFKAYLVYTIGGTTPTVTIGFTNSAAINFTNLHATATTILRGTAEAAIGNTIGIYSTGTSSTTSVATQVLTSGSVYVTTVEGYVVAASSTRLQLITTLGGSSPTLTSALGSNFVLTDLGSANYGNIG